MQEYRSWIVWYKLGTEERPHSIVVTPDQYLSLLFSSSSIYSYIQNVPQIFIPHWTLSPSPFLQHFIPYSKFRELLRVDTLVGLTANANHLHNLDSTYRAGQLPGYPCHLDDGTIHLECTSILHRFCCWRCTPPLLQLTRLAITLQRRVSKRSFARWINISTLWCTHRFWHYFKYVDTF